MIESNIIEEIIESVKYFKTLLEEEKNNMIEKIKELCTSDDLTLEERWYIFKECNLGHTKYIYNLFDSFNHIMDIDEYLLEYWNGEQYISIFDIIELIGRLKKDLIKEGSCTEEEYEKALEDLMNHILDEMVVVYNTQ